MYAVLDGALILKETGEVEESGPEAAKALPLLSFGDFKAIVQVDAIHDEGDAYFISIETDSTIAFNDEPAEIASLQIVEPGTFEIPLSGKMIAQRDPNAKAIRCKAEVDSYGPSLTYGVHLVPVI